MKEKHADVLDTLEMANLLQQTFEQACERVNAHRSLARQSRRFMAALSEDEKTFIDDWRTGDVWADDSRYAPMESSDAAHRMKLDGLWEGVFRRAPKLDKPMTMFRTLIGPMAKQLANAKPGECIELRSYSSFAHSALMSWRYTALVQRTASPLAVLALEVPKGTPFVYVSAFATFADSTPHQGGDVDLTQGEVVLPPCTLKRSRRQVKRTSTCQPYSERSKGDKREVAIVPVQMV